MNRALEICVVLNEDNLVRLRRLLGDWHTTHRMTPQKLSFLDFPQTGPVENLHLETDHGIIGYPVIGVGRGGF